MAADQDRASRIRELKEDHPELTWQAIADHVGVSMRAAQAWAEKGEIAYANAKKLAELFDDVDVDYIMRGPRGSADLMGSLSTAELLPRLASMEKKIDELLRFAAARALADAVPPRRKRGGSSGPDEGESSQTG